MLRPAGNSVFAAVNRNQVIASAAIYLDVRNINSFGAAGNKNLVAAVSSVYRNGRFLRFAEPISASVNSIVSAVNADKSSSAPPSTKTVEG